MLSPVHVYQDFFVQVNYEKKVLTMMVNNSINKHKMNNYLTS